MIEEVSVFDRAGTRVYTENNISTRSDYEGWDGKNQDNELLSPGVYVYLVKIKTQAGEKLIQSGDITLLH